MTVYGVQICFGCANGEQYDEIGTFWEKMRVLCPEAELLGVGFGWQDDTLCYLIGTENGVPEDAVEKISKRFSNAVHAKIQLPDIGWKTYTGTADTLDTLYQDIYKDGPLDYETEQIKADGTAVIRIWRKEEVCRSKE